MIAGVIIYFTHANWLDPLVSVLIGLLILYNAWGILRDAVDILLEGTPRDINVRNMVDDIIQVDGVLGVHDIHVWSLTQNMRTMSAHILTDDLHISAAAQIQREAASPLDAANFGCRWIGMPRCSLQRLSSTSRYACRCGAPQCRGTMLDVTPLDKKKGARRRR